MGVALVGSWNWLVAPLIVAALASMSAAHSWNSFHDWSITGLDKTESHSAEKPYTTGQALIRLGVVSPREVLVNSLLWATLAVIPVFVLAIFSTPWVFLPYFLVLFCAPTYSWGKLHYCPEVPLGLGFSVFAVWLGMSVSGEIYWLKGFLAAIPLFIIFGVWAEHVDQWRDHDSDWPKGGRSLGLLTAHLKVPLVVPLTFLLVLSYLSQIILMAFDILSPMTLLTLVALLPLSWSITLFETSFKKGVMIALLGMFLYQSLLVAGEVIGG